VNAIIWAKKLSHVNYLQQSVVLYKVLIIRCP